MTDRREMVNFSPSSNGITGLLRIGSCFVLASQGQIRVADADRSENPARPGAHRDFSIRKKLLDSRKISRKSFKRTHSISTIEDIMTSSTVRSCARRAEPLYLSKEKGWRILEHLCYARNRKNYTKTAPSPWFPKNTHSENIARFLGGSSRGRIDAPLERFLLHFKPLRASLKILTTQITLRYGTKRQRYNVKIAKYGRQATLIWLKWNSYVIRDYSFFRTILRLNSVISNSADNPDVREKTSPVFGSQSDCQFDYHIRIATDGTWFYRETPIRRPALVKLFSNILRYEEGAFWLVTPVERGRIQVDDAPFTAVELISHHDSQGPALTFRTNTDLLVTADSDHPILIRTRSRTRLVADLSQTDNLEQRPYLQVRPGLLALILRPVFYELVDLAVLATIQKTQTEQPANTVSNSQEQEEWGIWSRKQFFPLHPRTSDSAAPI